MASREITRAASSLWGKSLYDLETVVMTVQLVLVSNPLQASSDLGIVVLLSKIVLL